MKAQGMGGRCYPEAGNQFDHYTVEYTFADGAKLFCFLAPHGRLLGDVCRLRTRLEGIGRAHGGSGRAEVAHLQQPADR